MNMDEKSTSDLFLLTINHSFLFYSAFWEHGQTRAVLAVATTVSNQGHRYFNLSSQWTQTYHKSPSPSTTLKLI